MNKLLMLIIVFTLIGTASAQSISSTEYGDGWQKEYYSDGKTAYSNHETYLRWDNVWIPAEWVNISNGNWSYTVADTGTKMNFTADGKTISIPKANTKFDLSLFKISPSLTYSKTALTNNMISVNTTIAYLVFPYSLSQIKDYADEHNIRVGRWLFQAGQEHIDIYDDVVINHTRVDITGQTETYQSVTTLDKNYYQFRIVNGEIRLYFLKAEANKLSGNITFALKSWTVGEGGDAWGGNSIKDNTTLNRDTNRIMLRQDVDDYLSYYRLDGSAGSITYDENLTSNYNGTLSGATWTTSGKYGNAINFDGDNDKVDFGDINALDNINKLSVVVWTKPTTLTTSDAIIHKWNSTTPYAGFYIGTGSTTTTSVLWGMVGGYGQSTLSVSNGAWSHLSMIYNGTESTDGLKLKGYVNGVQKTLTFGASIPTTTGNSNIPLMLGVLLDDSRDYNGVIDDVRIYTRVLSASEIALIINNTMLTSGNLTTWYDSGAGNETHQVDVNTTTDANSNYTVWYANNATGSYSQLGGTLTGNNSLTITTKYQNTDVQVRLAGNTTSTPELIKVTFWTQTAEAVPDYFNSTWNTSLTSSGSSNATSIHLPLVSTGTYNFTVTWGDGNSSTITTYNQANTTHTYSTEGIYNLSISGTITGWVFNSAGDKLKLIDISHWGVLRFVNSASYFGGCANFNSTATDALDLTGITQFNRIFYNAISFNGYINNWDTSHITNFYEAFRGATSFNQPIGNWNTSSATGMVDTFRSATSFNQSINSWDVSHVEDMSEMFRGATSFNQDLNNWDLASLLYPPRMFQDATSFNGNVTSWVFPVAENFYYTFGGATSFNQNIGNWNVSNIFSMESMFDGVTLSTANYDAILNGWAALPSLQHDILFSGGNSKYSIVALSARNILTGTYGWTITDGGMEGAFSQSLYNTGWQTVFINSTQNMASIRIMMNNSNVQWIAKWNATSQKFEAYKAGWSYRATTTINGGDAVYLKVTNNDSVARIYGNGNYNWTLSTGYNLVGMDYNSSKNLSQINASVNNLGTCDADQITYVNPQTQVQYTYTCGLTNNQSISVDQGEGFWANVTTPISRIRTW